MKPEDAEPLLRAARQWAADDPDEATRAELGRLIEARATDELFERFHAPLEFGTAGLRGMVGAGPGRMNQLVVERTMRGLAAYLLARPRSECPQLVVVGHDARTDSARFARAACTVLSAAGIPVQAFEEAVPTPLVSYAVQRLGASAGIVITASHNPPEYNGIKLFGANGAQLAAPEDHDVAESIRRVVAGEVQVPAPATRGSVSSVPAALFDQYVAALLALRPPVALPSPLTIVYTPLHGVGLRFAEAAFRAAGHTSFVAVPEQADPDGRFPTVSFPNPEERGALDLALAKARAVGADLVVANDPDADRLAVCIPHSELGFTALTGNQIGLLLADYLLERRRLDLRPLVVSTVVSSPMLADIAEAHGARFERTLTGFKWVLSCGLALERTEPVRLLFAYEEAIGYCLAELVRDKDGISNGVLFADLTAYCLGQGETVEKRLERLYQRFGTWVSVQESVVRHGAAGAASIRHAMLRLGEAPPSEIGGRAVVGVTDYRVGAETRPPWRGKADLIELELEHGRVLVRPSGTEPKLKLYVDLRSPQGQSGSVSAATASLIAQARALAAAMVAALDFGAS